MGGSSCFFCWCQTCECVLLKESPAAAPSNQSSLCPVCPVPASFFLVCRACMLVLCLHAPARIAFAAPLAYLVFLLDSPYVLLYYLFLSLSVSTLVIRNFWFVRAVLPQATSTGCC